MATYPQRPLKILMCHGYTQSGAIFHGKTRALEKALKKAFPGGAELVYPTGPHALAAADIPDFGSSDASDSKQRADAAGTSEVFGWWRRRGDGVPLVYDGIEAGLARVAETLAAQGPFDGVVGFSQGGCLAGMVASLLEPGRKAAFDAQQDRGGMAWPAAFSGGAAANGCVQPPLRFAASYAGFAALPSELYAPFYEPQIRTPFLHVLGSLDTVVEEARSQRLVDACADGGVGRVVRHSGGHFLPASNKECTNALVLFIREAMGGEEGAERAEVEEERVEDMDVPF